MLCEIGGTVGDIEAMPFLEAIRQLGNDLPRGQAVYVHLTLMPYIPAAGELKTKPTQHSVKELRSIGIAPDILLVRADRPIPKEERRKLSLFCNVRESAVIQALDVAHIYDVPMAYHQEGLDSEVLAAFGIDPAPKPRMERWQEVSNRIHNPEGEVTIAVVGKYTGLKDAYKSLTEALSHGGMANKVRVKLDWIELRSLREGGSDAFPGEGPRHPGSRRIWRARLGRQDPGGQVRPRAQGALFRHLLRHADGLHRGGPLAGRRRGRLVDRVRPDRGAGGRPDDGMAEGQHAGEAPAAAGDLGGTMRLGAYEARLEPESKIAAIYGDTQISERHRHRYEVNIDYKERWRNAAWPLRACLPTASCRKRSNTPTIPGSSASSTTRS